MERSMLLAIVFSSPQLPLLRFLPTCLGCSHPLFSFYYLFCHTVPCFFPDFSLLKSWPPEITYTMHSLSSSLFYPLSWVHPKLFASLILKLLVKAYDSNLSHFLFRYDLEWQKETPLFFNVKLCKYYFLFHSWLWRCGFAVSFTCMSWVITILLESIIY